MVKDRQNDRLSYDAVFESFNLYVSALHHDVSASLRHSNGFATLLKEDVKTDPDALENWTEQIINAIEGKPVTQVINMDTAGPLEAMIDKAVLDANPDFKGEWVYFFVSTAER